jgi:hypothetical protein
MFSQFSQGLVPQSRGKFGIGDASRIWFPARKALQSRGFAWKSSKKALKSEAAEAQKKGPAFRAPFHISNRKP